MANTFLDPSEVVRDSAIILQDNLVAGNLLNRQVEQKFAQYIGESVDVKVVPNLGDADEFTSSTSATNITEEARTVTLEKHFYKKVTLTSKQKTLSLDDFAVQVANPAALSLKESIDSFFITKMANGFARNLTGTAGTSPSTIAHIVNARKAIRDARGTYNNVASIINTTAEASFLQLAQFTNADYGSDRPVGLKEASLGRMHGASFFSTQNVGTMDQGDTAGTVLVNGDPGTSNTIAMDAFTAATGTIYEGTRFTVADDSSSTTYTVTEDATIASNAVSLSVTPAADASIADNKAVTFETEPTENIIYNIDAVYGAIVAPAPFSGTPSAVENIGGMSVRSSFFSDGSALTDSYIIDTFCGCRVIHPESGTIFNGS